MQPIKRLTLIFSFISFTAACSDDAVKSNTKDTVNDFTMADLTKLSETGLYQNITMDTIAANIKTYAPRFELYSDNLQKIRSISLPARSQIVPQNLELWDYPVGTKIWKEFATLTNGVKKKIETRLLEKSESTWKVATYIWNSEQTEATRWGGENGTVPITIPLSESNRHTVPSYSQCTLCHNQKSQTTAHPSGEPVLGFTAFQLSRESIEELVTSGVLQQPAIPWQRHRTFAVNTLERDVIGYLHANCGHCHNPRRPDMVPGLGNPNFTLNYNLESHNSRANTNLIRQFGKGVASQGDGEFPADAKLLVPGNPNRSMIFLRMNTASIRHRMPLVGIEDMDQTFITTRLTPWIQRLSN